MERYGRQEIQLSDISELKPLLSLLDCKLSGMENPSAKAVVQRLTTVIVGLVVENVVNATIAQSKLQGTVTRHKEIVWEFRDLLENNYSN